MTRKSRRRLAKRFIFPTNNLLNHFPPNTSLRQIAHQIGASPETIQTWQTQPRNLDTHQADRYATRLGKHPSQIWPNWFDLPEYTPEKAKQILNNDQPIN